MTKDEIRAFIKQTMVAEAPSIIGADEVIDDGIIAAIDIITDRWAEDVEDAIAEADEISDADACDGPCCTGIIAPTYSEVDCD